MYYKLICILIFGSICFHIFSQKIDTSFYRNGNYEYGQFDKGKKVGVWIKKYSNHNIRSITKYYNDSLFNSRVYQYKNDDTVLTQKYGGYITNDNKKINGEYITYFLEGSIKSITNYVNGKKDGIFFDYYKDGAIEIKGSFKQDFKHGKYSSFYNDGRIFKKGKYYKDELAGKWKYYFPNGQLQSVGFYSPGHEQVEYYFNKIDSLDKMTYLHFELNYNDGYLYPLKIPNKKRKWRYYYSNGNIQIKGCYNSHGKRNGLWKYYSEEGRLIKEEEWNVDKLISTKEY